MAHFKKYWLLYLLALVAIITLVVMNWITIKGWFSSIPGTGRQKMCKEDSAGCYVMIGQQREYVDCSACPDRTF